MTIATMTVLGSQPGSLAAAETGTFGASRPKRGPLVPQASNHSRRMGGETAAACRPGALRIVTLRARAACARPPAAGGSGRPGILAGGAARASSGIPSGRQPAGRGGIRIALMTAARGTRHLSACGKAVAARGHGWDRSVADAIGEGVPLGRARGLGFSRFANGLTRPLAKAFTPRGSVPASAPVAGAETVAPGAAGIRRRPGGRRLWSPLRRPSRPLDGDALLPARRNAMRIAGTRLGCRSPGPAGGAPAARPGHDMRARRAGHALRPGPRRRGA